MINEQLAVYLTPAYVAGGAVALLCLLSLWNVYSYSRRFKAAGGIAAGKLSHSPIKGLSMLYGIGRAQATNNMLGFFNSIWVHADQENPNIVEINLTGGQRFLFTQEPSHIKTILTGKFADYGKGEDFHRVWRPFLGDSIFTTDHKQWQESRNLLRPMFIKNRVSDLDIFERRTQVMLQQFPASGETFDLMDLFYRMTIDVITEFLLGESVNSLQKPSAKFVQAFTDVQRWQTMLTVLIPAESLIPRYWYNKAIKTLEEFIVPFIDRALALPQHELDKLSKSEKSFTFLHALASHTRDPQVIRDQIVAVLLAGRDTTAATLSWTFYQLARHPEVYARLRSEVLGVCGTDRKPDYEDLKSMRYLSHTLNETLRLYPAVPFNVRYALADSTLPSATAGRPDITVVKGDAVFYSTIAMQRRADLYPAPSPTFADPAVFSPERWEHWTPKAWSYVPFNGGPRICLGQNFALTEMAYVVVRMVQRYERLEYRGDWEKQFHKVEIVGTPGHGIPVAMYEAPGGAAGEMA